MPPGFLCPDAQDNTLSSAVVFEGTRGSPLRTLSALYDIGHRYGAPIWGPHNSGQGEEGRSVTFPAEMVAETRGCWKSKPREPAGVKCCRRAQPPWGRVPRPRPLCRQVKRCVASVPESQSPPPLWSLTQLSRAPPPRPCPGGVVACPLGQPGVSGTGAPWGEGSGSAGTPPRT